MLIRSQNAERNQIKELYNSMKELQQNAFNDFTESLLKNKDLRAEIEQLKATISKMETTTANEYDLK